MALIDAYRRARGAPEMDGTASGLVKHIRYWRNLVKKPKPTEQAISDLNYYESLVHQLEPLLDLSEHVGYQQWRDDVRRRLDQDLAEWPERFLGWIKAGYSETQLLLAATVFAGTQVQGRQMFTVVDSAEHEKAKYDRYQEKAKATEGTVSQ